MDPAPRIHFVEHYIDPIIQHRACQVAFQIALEIVKIVAAKIFLDYLGKRLLNDASKMSPREVFIITVFAPVIEEIIFRGALLRGIHVMQKGWNHVQGHELSEEEERTQQTFRVHLSALIFAAAHLLNPHKNVASALVQFTWTYFGGVTYGYLSEKYRTLSVNILAHGFNNSLAVAARIYPPHFAPLFLVAIIVNKLGAYIFAVTAIDEVMATGIRRTVAFVVAIPGQFFNRNEDRQERPVEAVNV